MVCLQLQVVCVLVGKMTDVEIIAKNHTFINLLIFSCPQNIPWMLTINILDILNRKKMVPSEIWRALACLALYRLQFADNIQVSRFTKG